ncbi:30S ribosomal protein S6 [Planctomycetales bacterium 10988]|nr:30S ribosomal protein S6 [Planctomycetales bacterium 10988]
MAETVYDGLFLLDSNKFVSDMAGVQKALETLITDQGGEILASRLWDERRLAYPIDGHKKGHYWLIFFKIEGEKIEALRREVNIVDYVLRSMIVKVDPRIANTLVSHALGIVPEEEAAAEEGEATESESETSAANA